MFRLLLVFFVFVFYFYFFSRFILFIFLFLLLTYLYFGVGGVWYPQVTQLILHRDEAGESKRFAFVTFADKESTKACLDKLEGLEVAGKALSVRCVSFEGSTYYDITDEYRIF